MKKNLEKSPVSFLASRFISKWNI